MSEHLEITMRDDRLDCAATITSEAALEDFVRRLWCAAEGIWPTPEATPADGARAARVDPPPSRHIAQDRESGAPLVEAAGKAISTAICETICEIVGEAAPPPERPAGSYELTGLQERLLNLLRETPGKPLRIYADKLGVTEASISIARKRLRELGLVDVTGLVV